MFIQLHGFFYYLTASIILEKSIIENLINGKIVFNRDIFLEQPPGVSINLFMLFYP